MCLGRDVSTWLSNLQRGTAAHTYFAYGAVYITVALAWLWLVESQRPTRWDIIGATVSLIGMSIIILGDRER
jgi:small multidrug resistance family-3 protein